MTKKINILISDKEERVVAIIEHFLQELSFDMDIHSAKDFFGLLNFYDSEALNIFIVDVSDNPDFAIEQIDRFDSQHDNCKFIISSYGLKTAHIIKFLQNSKKDFIEKPIIKNNLLKIVQEIILKKNSEQDFSGQGKLISIYSNKGGLGKTTIAVNLARELAKKHKQSKVVLVDINMFLGDVTTFLDLSPAYDLKYLSDIADTEENIINFVTQYNGSNMFVIADSIYRDYSVNITKDSIIRLFNRLRKVFQFIIVDCSSAITEKVKYLFDFSDLILLVTESNLSVLSNCKKCLDFLEKIGAADKTELVLNRYSFDDECSIEDIENVLQKNIFNIIPNDWKSVTDSINRGLTIGECYPKTAIYDSFVDFANLITDNLCH